jgi:hypothetical protein
MIWTLFVGVVVRAANAAIHGLKATLDMLEDTSADVGEWLLHRRGI